MSDSEENANEVIDTIDIGVCKEAELFWFGKKIASLQQLLQRRKTEVDIWLNFQKV